jgi:uncharacterized protein (TIGR03083 family)
MTTDALLPPSGLRERVLTAARNARPVGRPLPPLPPISPVEALRRAVEDFDSLLSALNEEEWHSPTPIRGLTVQGVVGHLIGVEEHVQRALSGDPEMADIDHIAGTQDEAVRQTVRPVEQTRRAWREAADRTLALAAEADLGQVVKLYGRVLPVGGWLIVRAFEDWIHADDNRAAIGLPATVPDTPSLRLMTDLVARALPNGVARVPGGSTPVNLHLVLTGPGGGAWDVPIGAHRGDSPDQEVPETLVVADAVDFCQLAAKRLPPDDIKAYVTGAVDQAARIFAAAATLSMDE